MSELLHDTLNPTAGTLHDPQAWGSEREGMFFLFRGAFQSFRDRRAHEFVDTDPDEAFDLIVLANRLLLLIEEGQQRLPQPQPARPYPSLSQPLLYVDSAGGIHQDEVYEKGRHIVDADNDGEPELLVLGQEKNEVFRAFKYVEGKVQRFEVERVDRPIFPRDLLLTDVDNDGLQEIACIGYGAYNNVVLFYRYQNGRYEILKKAPQAEGSDAYLDHSFLAAHVADIDSDGENEVVSEPKPLGRIPPQDRYVWKWNKNDGVFQLLYNKKLRSDNF